MWQMKSRESYTCLGRDSSPIWPQLWTPPPLCHRGASGTSWVVACHVAWAPVTMASCHRGPKAPDAGSPRVPKRSLTSSGLRPSPPFMTSLGLCIKSERRQEAVSAA